MKELFCTFYSTWVRGLVVSAMKGQKSRLVMGKKKFHFAYCTKNFIEAKKYIFRCYKMKKKFAF